MNEVTGDGDLMISGVVRRLLRASLACRRAPCHGHRGVDASRGNLEYRSTFGLLL